MKILISDKLAEEGITILKSVDGFEVDCKFDINPNELKSIIKDFDALIVRSGTKVTADVIEAADKLKVIGRAGVGLDNVDLKAATKKGIVAMNTPAGNTTSTAEHTMSLILALSRNIPQACASLKSGNATINRPSPAVTPPATKKGTPSSAAISFKTGTHRMRSSVFTANSPA